ncbi:conserved unknown protein [Ectocarpus siliculosus]|uniref:Uncharacterized protein n=1 Tax=Ectocarpus siliculosus TaxID=2880 RepID=D7G6W6_ECTSI|nr:conserved unknown protein [Ectocarpus siliculosus]|eukprot:CBJ25659.1 conserved unknown protein [Ectocarpus siliculosus]
MRDLRNRLRAAVVFCAAGPVASFLPLFSPARARAGLVGAPCSRGVEPRRSPSRAPVGSTQLEATAERPEGHALQEGQEEKASSSASVDTPPAAAPASPVVDRSSAEGGEEKAGLAQNVAAVAKETDATASVGQSAEEEEVMAELLAHQPGGQDEAQEVDAALKPSKRVTKRLKKYFPKDFQDTTWTVAIQWNHSKYEVKTTKVALKADGEVVWLDKGKGSWILRTKSRDISIYRNFFLNWAGMRIFSAKLLNNTCDMYLSGVIKGWQPFLPLSKMGTWQAVRRGITLDENTPRPPWESREVVKEVTMPDGRKRKNTPIEIDVDLD